jgi:trimethylamine---corrinoid protein Co-methyltransferase
VGPGGNFLADEHTVQHFREELWMPGPAWTRQSWDGWEPHASTSMAQRVREQVQTLLATHEVEPLDEKLAREIDRIVARATDERG